jgi:uncharacterized protein YndB with AHSA1/START domain
LGQEGGSPLADSIKFSIDLPVSPERIYRAWMDSYEHSRFTGSPARIEEKQGGKFTARDGYIQGENQVLSPFGRIVQTWRTTDFPADSPDSTVEIKLEPTCLGSQLTLTQTGIPDGQSQRYMEVWEKDYFRPLLAYFEEIVGDYTADQDG